MKTWSYLIAIMIGLGFNSCRDKDFDEPPVNGQDPNLTVNMTIDSLKKIYQDTVINQNKIPTITQDWIISGIVTADDKSGNFYKTVVIDDGTAGISIRLDISNFYTDYPIGRKIFVKLKGLVIGDYANMIQLGGYVDVTDPTRPEAAPIPSTLVRNYIFGGTWGNAVVPYKVTIGDLANTYKWQNRLIQLDNVQFIGNDTAEQWADPVTLSSVNRTITDCYNNQLLVRTSGYSSFASRITPSGSGSITAIFGVFLTDKQLAIRDVNDADMGLARFVVGTCPPPPAVLTSIASIRNEYTGSATAVSSGKKIVGIVISDYVNNNSDPKNLFIQDATAGIVVRFTSSHTFTVGDSVEVNVGGQTLSEYNGLLEVGGSTPSVPLINALKLGTGTIIPREVTVAQVVANMAGTSDTWESTLIKITNPPTSITFSAPTFSTTTNIIDGTGTMLMYTRTAALFSGATIATPATGVTCIVSDFNAVQLFVRSAADIEQ